MSRKDRATCCKCGRNKRVDDFFTHKDGVLDEMCKDCLLEHVDNAEPDTFRWILERFDLPYVERIWADTANKAFREKPGEYGPKSVFGKYLRIMRMAQYRAYTYADTDRLNADGSKPLTDEEEAALKARFEAGEISSAQYDTLSGKVRSKSRDAPSDYKAPARARKRAEASITDEDRDYLMAKWGTSYTAEEWLRMEATYKRYADAYDLNVDREEVLRKMCKTSLKMDEALDADNLLDYKSLSQVFETLRKSARFTEAQNAEDKSGLVSSVGQLVQLCEREGGIIEQFPDPEDYPTDKVDLTINDYKQYAVGLLRNEPNIAGLIESYVAKLEKMEAERSGIDSDVLRVDEPVFPEYDDDGLEIEDDTDGGKYAWSPDHSYRFELDENGFVTHDEMDRLLGVGWEERLNVAK